MTHSTPILFVSPLVILVTGLPASGKTTVARQVARHLGLPVFGKDDFKEVLFDTLGWKDLEWSRQLSQSCHGLLQCVVETKVTNADLEPESWIRDSRPTEEIRKELLQITGVGPYAAASILMLLGRYDEIAVDTVFRAFVTTTYFDDRVPSAKQVKAVYDRWGQWRFLAYWFDRWPGMDTVL